MRKRTNMEIKKEIEVSIIEHMNGSNEDGAIDDKEVCKVEEDEVEELKFESNCNSEDKHEGPIDPDKGEEHLNEDTFGVEDSKDEIKAEEIDTTDRIAARKNSRAIALEESKQKIDLSDNRFYGRHRGRSTRILKRINYNESAESEKIEPIPEKIQSPKCVKEDDFFIPEENDIKIENIENSDPLRLEEDETKGKIKVGVVLGNIRYYRSFYIGNSDSESTLITLHITIVNFENVLQTLEKTNDSGKARERKFKCDQCNYAATWKHSLKKHKQIHNSTKDFRCDQCDYASNTEDNLRKNSANGH